MKCQAKTLKGARCNNNRQSGCVVVLDTEVGKVRWEVCGTHFKSDLRSPDDFAVFGERMADPTAPVIEQLTMPISNTDGLAHVQALKEQIMDTDYIRIMVTGHGDLGDADNEKRIREVLTDLLQMYINTYGKQRIIVVSGGSLGADTLWARVAYSMGVPFELYVPTGYEQIFVLKEKDSVTKKWVVKHNGRELLAKWYKMVELASAVYDEDGDPRNADAPYAKRSTFKRNTTMVKVSDHHIAVSIAHPHQVIANQRWSGGTYHCIREMKRLGIKEITWVPVNNSNIKASYIVRLNEEDK